MAGFGRACPPFHQINQTVPLAPLGLGEKSFSILLQHGLPSSCQDVSHRYTSHFLHYLHWWLPTLDLRKQVVSSASCSGVEKVKVPMARILT